MAMSISNTVAPGLAANASIAQPAAPVSNASATAMTSDSLSLSGLLPQPSAANDGTTYTVQSGDTLSGIASSQLGDANQWQALYQQNQDQIADPNLIYPGQVLSLPGAQEAADPQPAALPVAPAPAPRCPLPVRAPQASGADRGDLLRQKLQLLRLQQQVVQMELKLDSLLDQLGPSESPDPGYADLRQTAQSA